MRMFIYMFVNIMYVHMNMLCLYVALFILAFPYLYLYLSYLRLTHQPPPLLFYFLPSPPTSPQPSYPLPPPFQESQSEAFISRLLRMRRRAERQCQGSENGI